MNRLMQCLQTNDTAGYYDLFPPFDTLWSMVVRNPDNSPEAQKELNNLKERPQVLVEFDPLYNRDIVGGFCRVLSKGEDSGVQWRSTVMARYELRRQDPTRNLIGYDHIAPERFQGYLFVSDAFNRVIFCITVSEVQKIKGQFFGGQLHNILEAKTVDEFHRKEQKERDYFAWLATQPDTVAADTAGVAKTDTTGGDSTAVNPLVLAKDEPEEDDDTRREVVDRRYYEGMLDNEIPIKFYIRYMRTMPGRPQQYDGLYKLGENKRYLKLEITRTAEGKWMIEDEGSTGFMELKLVGKTYTGAWTNADENGFDVVLTQTGTPPGKIETFDRILDRGASSRVDEDEFETEEKGGGKKTKEEKKDKKTEKGGGKTVTDSKDKAADTPKKEQKADDKAENDKKAGDTNTDDSKKEQDKKEGDRKERRRKRNKEGDDGKRKDEG